MNPTAQVHQSVCAPSSLVWVLLILFLQLPPLTGQNAVPNPSATIISFKAPAHVARKGSEIWDPVFKEQHLYSGDRIRTGEFGEIILRISRDKSLLRLAEVTDLAFPEEAKTNVIVRFFQGLIHLFHRGAPSDYRIESPGVSTIIRGTEFVMSVNKDGEVGIHMVNGTVSLGTTSGAINLNKGESGAAQPQSVPTKTPSLSAVNAMQWELYYPGFLHWPDLEFSNETSIALGPSLDSYRKGDPYTALELATPVSSNPSRSQVGIYHSVLHLNNGDLEQSKVFIERASSKRNSAVESEIIEVIGNLIEMVQGHGPAHIEKATTATSWLSESFIWQSQMELKKARDAAYQATTLAPNFGYGWTQVAELEFGFGNFKEAFSAISHSIELSPSNAKARSVKGFLFLARKDFAAASQCFDEAIELDPRLGSPWLGQGLILIHQGRLKEGLRLLETATVVEPQRSFFRSYLARAMMEDGLITLAEEELEIAKSLDRRDPSTSYFSGLHAYSRNRINQAIKEIENSIRLNANRGLYRSKFLLDRDQAVRGANLASIYSDAGLLDFGYREAISAIHSDYLSTGGHLFLAETYNAFRHPLNGSLQFETPWFSEFLLSRLLAPVGSSSVSPIVSQQEYSRLFNRNHLGFVTDSEYLSRGDFTQSIAQYGFYERTNYSVDATYRSLTGTRSFNELEDKTVSVRLKQGIGENDSLFFQSVISSSDQNDPNRYYAPEQASESLRIQEEQLPLLLGGYHRYWSPSARTLVLASYLDSNLDLKQQDFERILFLENLQNQPDAVSSPGKALASLNYANRFRGLSIEPQHIIKSQYGTLILGSRFFSGTMSYEDGIGQSSPSPFQNQSGNSAFSLSAPAASGEFKDSIQRSAIYSYYLFRLSHHVQMTTGISYDRLDYPSNYSSPPVSNKSHLEEKVSPKVGIFWRPRENTTVRFGYAQSIGGVSLENSIQLEPSQVAGFTQNYRSVLPESLVGSVSAEDREIIGLAIDNKWNSRSYFSASLEFIQAEASRKFGATSINVFPSLEFDSLNVVEDLGLEETRLTVLFQQLLDSMWSLGVKYQLSESTLSSDLPAIPDRISSLLGEGEDSTILHTLGFTTRFNHPSGWHGRVEATLRSQSNQDYNPPLPGDEFWQFNILGGYRFNKRRSSIETGIMNLTDQDYRLNPLGFSTLIPRERLFLLRFRHMF